MCADTESPAKNFFWGSLKSLNHPNLSEMVVDFWKNHYTANRMTLAVQSKLSTHETFEMINDLFSEVPTTDQPPPEFKINQEPFCMDLFHKIYKVKTVTSSKRIILYWYLPPVIHLYKIKPLQYISWVLGHEGKGTLISYLRKLKYAMELKAEIDDDFYNTKIYSIFSVDIELTDLGLEYMNKVIELTFSYLNLMREKGVSEDIYKQIQIIAENEFNFAENVTAVDHVTELSQNMLMYDEEDYLSGPLLYLEYSPETIAKFLNLLTANRVAVFVLSNKFENVQSFLNDPIFGTKYLPESFTEELENKWLTVEPHPFFEIHSENQYLTTQFSILPQSNDMKYPEKIYENDYIELWYKQDSHFKLPKTYAMFKFITPLPSKSLVNYMCLELFWDSALFLLKEETYSAVITELHYSVEILKTGFEITFHGFNEKLPLLIDIVIQCLKNYESLITEEIFTMIKSKAINSLKNFRYDLDYVTFDLQRSLIEDPNWDLEQRINCINDIDYKQLLTFYKQLKDLYCQALIQGNINQTQAINISEKIVSTLNYQPLDKKSYPNMSIKRLNQGDCRIQMLNKNPTDKNCIVFKYYQFDKNELNDSVKYFVLESLVQESAFNELRTKQCLGYDVEFSVANNQQHYGFYLKVAHQLDKFDTQFVFNRIDEFIKQFWENFDDPDEVNKVKDALIALKSVPDDSLLQEFNRNKKEIIKNRFKFNLLEIEIEALKNLKFEDIKNLKDGFFLVRGFSIEIIGNVTTKDKDEDNLDPPFKKICLEEKNNFTYISSIEEYKSKLNSY